MRTVLAYFALALVLIIAGAALWTTGRLEERLVNARKQLLTMQYKAPLGEYDGMERSVRYAANLPWVTGLVAEVRGQRATSKYWGRDYTSLALERNADNEMTEQDPSILLVAANAAFRRTRLDGGVPAIVQQLEQVLGQYADVLKRAPQQFDAAYNYEFVARTRDTLARSRPGRSGGGRDKALAKLAASQQTIHGQRGGPPASSDPSDFEILVPQSQEERGQIPKAGLSGTKVRKG